MGVLLLIFAVSMAAATFIENDYGSAAAYSFIYNTRWFELILLLLSANLIGQMIILKLYRKSKLTIFLFHLSFVLMITGAGITRYFGWEGTIHIREGEEQDKCFSNDTYLGYTFRDDNGAIIKQHSEKYSMTSVSADNYKKKISINDLDYKIALTRIIPNATEIITDNPQGEPVVSLIITKNMVSKEKLILRKNESKTVHDISIGFASTEPGDINISLDSGVYFIQSKDSLSEMNMMTRETKNYKAGELVELKKMQIISANDIKIVPQELSIAGVSSVTAVNRDKENTGQNAFIFHISSGKETSVLYLWNKDTDEISTGSTVVDGKSIEISFGSKVTVLPFRLKLNDFILERYPGSNSPSGYKSDVILIDKSNGIEKPFIIFMNNILKYKGYRFYQSSYDQDEMGTILSVNHDMGGMLVTYTGYGLLFLFIILSLINKKSVFHTVNAGYWSSSLRKTVPIMLIIFLLSGFGSTSAQKLIPDKESAMEFGKVLVQDQKGRTKPLFTLSNDILRKVTRENSYEGLTSMQVFLGIYLDFNNWKDVPLIRVSNKDLRKMLGVRGNLAAFSDLVDLQGEGTYKLSDDVSRAYSRAPGERTKTDKEIMKVDERVNILFMINTGGFLRIFPLKDGSHNWGSPQEAIKSAVSKEDSIYLNNIIPMFAEALQTNNAGTARQISESVISYQKRFTEYDLPSETKSKAELLYYKLMIFEKLFPYYATIGLVMLIGLIFMVIRGNKEPTLFIRILGWMLFAGFLFHTFGLGLRWYISGHSPMSNGYESMIFISWVTLLAGFIFSRKSAFALSATGMLAAFTLMVAHLSFIDPEITNLVPVLKSYWLTLHVSVITGSYGFLGLGGILGIITMILLTLSNKKNRERISNTIDELTVINYRTLILGLYFLTIGTFLGAVWANESWGRYWGWDPKETWSLITLIIYTFVTHSRRIPGLKNIYTFNLLSLFAFSSVLMTYFGVNYYLSGLHSYAGGDPVPVPLFVYIAVIVLVTLSLSGYWKYRKWVEDGIRTHDFRNHNPTF